MAGTLPPVRVTLPTVELTVPPTQLVRGLGVAARTSPLPGVVGKVSVTLVTVMAPLFGLVTVMVKVDTAPAAIEAGAKTLARVGANAVTVRFAVLETALMGASVLVTPVVLLGNRPGVLLLITMATVQLLLAGMVRPLMFNKPD